MKKKIKVYDVIIAVLVLIMAVSIFMIVRSIVIGRREQGEFEEIASLITLTKPEQSDEATKGPDETQESARDISAVLAQNKDCVGWIYINNSIINYPVMHTPNDPEKYLHLSFYGNTSHAGTPFLDARCEINGSMNTILYGHNMKNGTMFHQLKRYRNLQYTLDNPIIEYQTAEGLKKYQIFAVCEVEGNDKWYSFVGDINETMYNNRIQYIKSKDLFETGLTPTYPQKLITLSTCKDASDKGRLIVIGMEIE